MPLREVHEKLMVSNCSVAPVLDDGELIGIVDKENINELIMVKGALMRETGSELDLGHRPNNNDF